MTPSEQHAYDAGRFAALVEAAPAAGWARPSPVAGWTALDVVEHLVEWLPGFVERSGVTLATVDVARDPAAAWRQRSDDVQEMLDLHGEDAFESPMFGRMTLGAAVNQFYVNDVWMHSWDLARALDVGFDLGAERCEAALAMMAPMDEALRASGQFGPAVAVGADASPQDRLVAFIGRDPAWQPA